MSRLNIECIRAFLEQALQVVTTEKREVSGFLKCMTVSKLYLTCSQSKKYSVYCLGIWPSKSKASIYLSPNLDKYYSPKLYLNFEKTRLLIILLNPYLIELRFSFDTTINSIEECSSLLDSVSGKISLHSNTRLENVLPLMTKFSSQIVKLQLNGRDLPIELPSMKLDYLKIVNLKSTKQLKSCIQRQTIKKLEIYVFNIFDDFHNVTFVYDGTLNLELNLWALSDADELKRINNSFKRIFPNLNSCYLIFSLFDITILNEVFNTNNFLSIVAKNFNPVQKLKDSWQYENTKICFLLHIDVQNETYTDDWIQQMENDNRFSNLQLISREPTVGGYADIFKFSEVCNKDSIKYTLRVWKE